MIFISPSRRCHGAAAAALCLVAFGAISTSVDGAPRAEILSAVNDGGQILTDCALLLETPQPYGLAIDSDSGDLYWSTSDPIHLAILRRPLAGGPTVEVTSLVQQVGGIAHIAIDHVHGWIYFVYSDDPNDAIYRAALSGSAPTVLVTAVAGGLSVPRGIAVDPAAGMIYWADTGAGVIKRAHSDGSGISTVLGGLGGPVGLALDQTNGILYWVDSAVDRIESVHTDGSQHTIVKSTGLVNPHSIALDAGAGRLYWTDFGTGTVGSCNVDGSDETTECANAGGLRGIAIVPAPPCVCDLNDNGSVEAADLSILLGYWGTSGGAAGADFDASGLVDGGDLAVILGAWGACPS